MLWARTKPQEEDNQVFGEMLASLTEERRELEAEVARLRGDLAEAKRDAARAKRDAAHLQEKEAAGIGRLADELHRISHVVSVLGMGPKPYDEIRSATSSVHHWFKRAHVHVEEHDLGPQTITLTFADKPRLEPAERT
jgi:chromosome segregation ATPase